MKKTVIIFCCVILSLCLCACAPIKTTEQETVSEQTSFDVCVHDRWYISPDYQAGYDHYTDTIDYPCPKEGCNGILYKKPDELSVEVKAIQDGIEIEVNGGLNPSAKVIYKTKSNPFLWEMMPEDVVSSNFQYCGHGTFKGQEDILSVEINAIDETGRIANKIYTVSYIDGQLKLEEANN